MDNRRREEIQQLILRYGIEDVTEVLSSIVVPSVTPPIVKTPRTIESMRPVMPPVRPPLLRDVKKAETGVSHTRKKAKQRRKEVLQYVKDHPNVCAQEILESGIYSAPEHTLWDDLGFLTKRGYIHWATSKTYKGKKNLKGWSAVESKRTTKRVEGRREWVAEYVQKHPGCTVNEIAEASGLQSASNTRKLQEDLSALEADGLVVLMGTKRTDIGGIANLWGPPVKPTQNKGTIVSLLESGPLLIGDLVDFVCDQVPAFDPAKSEDRKQILDELELLTEQRVINKQEIEYKGQRVAKYSIFGHASQ